MLYAVLIVVLFVSLLHRHLGLDLVPRKDFEVVDSDQISVSDLYKMVRTLTWRVFSFSLQKVPFSYLHCMLGGK